MDNHTNVSFSELGKKVFSMDKKLGKLPFAASLPHSLRTQRPSLEDIPLSHFGIKILVFLPHCDVFFGGK